MPQLDVKSTAIPCTGAAARNSYPLTAGAPAG